MLGLKQRNKTKLVELNAATIQIYDRSANYFDSMIFLHENGLRPLTYQEAFIGISSNLSIKKRLEGKWFYLSGKGLKELGHYSFNDQGEIIQQNGDLERTIYVYNGNKPLSLGVSTDPIYNFDKKSFSLYAHFDPKSIAPIIVGVKDEGKALKLRIKTFKGLIRLIK